MKKRELCMKKRWKWNVKITTQGNINIYPKQSKNTRILQQPTIIFFITYWEEVLLLKIGI